MVKLNPAIVNVVAALFVCKRPKIKYLKNTITPYHLVSTIANLDARQGFHRLDIAKLHQKGLDSIVLAIDDQACIQRLCANYDKIKF